MIETATRTYAWSLEGQVFAQDLIESVRRRGNLRRRDRDFLRMAEQQLKQTGYLSPQQEETVRRLARRL